MIRTRALVLVPGLLLALTGCGGQATTSSSSGSSGVVQINVAVKNHKVSPRASVHKVARGKTVRIVVTTDKPDEVHVHGFNKEVETVAGRPTTIQFTANLTGRFEVETHKSNLQLFQLQVS